MKIMASTIFFGVDFKKGHRGLLSLTEKMEVNPKDLVLFVNKSMTGLKAMIGSHTMIYYKSDRLTISQIRNLPTLFGGEKLQFSREVLSQIIEAFDEKIKAVG
jgi:hypothetical protein